MPKSKLIHDAAMFDLGPPALADDWVEYKDSLLFRAGNYAQKSFSMTPEELKAAVEQFTEAVPNELEHINSVGIATILDGKLGHVQDVRLSDDGTELRGTVKIPRWLDTAWATPHKQVSAVWDRGTKTLKALGLVMKGHVKGAALMAAFADSGEMTRIGQSILQSIHDQAAACGAVCTMTAEERAEEEAEDAAEGETPAAFHSEAELEAIQAVHDAAVAGGAECHLLDEEDFDDLTKAVFTARKRTPEATKHMQGIHDHIVAIDPTLCANPAAFGDKPKQLKAYAMMHAMSVEHGATCPGKSVKMSDTPTGNARKVLMTAREKLSRALFGENNDAPELSITEAQAEAALVALEPKTPDPAALFAASPEAKAMQAKIAALEARDEKNRRDAIEKDAVRFSADVSRAGRIPPVLKADFASLLVRFAEDDHAHPEQVTFSDAKTNTETKGTRVDALMAFVAKLPSDLHDVPQLDGSVNFAEKYRLHFSEGEPKRKDGDMTQAEEDALLNLYPTGAKIVAARQKARA